MNSGSWWAKVGKTGGKIGLCATRKWILVGLGPQERGTGRERIEVAAMVKIGAGDAEGKMEYVWCFGATRTDLTFDLGREGRFCHFGHGILVCLGAALRRMLH